MGISPGVMNQYPLEPISRWNALIPLVGLLLVLACACVYLHRSRKERVLERVSTLLWALPSAVVLLVLAVLCGFKLYISFRECLIATVVLAACSGCFVFLRTRAARDLDDLNGKAALLLSAARDLLVLLIAGGVSFLVLEIPWNDQLLVLAPTYLAVNLLILLAIHIVAYFLSGMRGTIPCLVVLGCLIVGLIQYFVSLFKGSAIMPSDVLAAGTALSVSGGYDYTFGAAQIIVFGLVSLAIALLAFIRPSGTLKLALGCRVKRSGVSFGVGVAACIALCFCFVSISFSDDLGFTRSYWDALVAYRQQGFLGSFITLVQNAQIRVPEGYANEKAEEVLGSRASRYQDHLGASASREAAEQQFEVTTPTVIAVMNESFSDFSTFDGLGVGYEGPARLKGVEDALYTGYVYSSVMGGGTCNSEFEFLTGASMGFVGTSNQPYIMHNLSDVASLPKQFEESGYSTTAIHPNQAMNWNRDVIYSQIGFDQFFDINAFSADAPTRHMGVTDLVTYEKILQQITSNDSPQFIFDVTMQNHSGYGTWDLPESERLDYDFSWLNEKFPDVAASVIGQTEEYISLIETSDRDLSTFIEELRSLDKPVVLVFFGDHQPAFGQNTYFSVSGEGEQGSVPAFEQLYSTPYMIWANYDVAGNDQISERRDLGISSLGALLNHAIGAPMSDWQMAQMDIMEEIPIINGFGYQTADGAWHQLGDEADTSSAVRDLEWIQYLEYASKI